MLLLLTDDTWSRALTGAAWLLGGWLVVSVPVALAVGRLIHAGKGPDREED